MSVLPGVTPNSKEPVPSLMCGRFSFFVDPDVWEEWAENRLKTEVGLPDDFRGSYNIAPQDDVVALAPQLSDTGLTYMTWGYMPYYANNPEDSIINARSDKVLESDAWNESFRERRCLIPADGFYEWSEDGTPYRVRLQDDEPFFMAGLWREWQPSQEQMTLGDNIATDSRHTNAIITTDANSVVEPVHDRMPVILDTDEVDTYLEGDAEDAQELLSPYRGDDLEVYEVSEKVNDPGNDTPGVVLPTES